MIKSAIDSLTALELSPVELVRAAAQVDCRTVGIVVQGSRYFPFPESGLLNNVAAVTELVSTREELGVEIDCIECFAVDKNFDADGFRPAFEVGQKLGAKLINTLAMDRNPDRLAQSYGKLCQTAAEYGMGVLTEVHRALAHSSVTGAAEFAEKNGLDMKVQLDSLHFFRYGGQVEEIVRHGNRIGRAQLCDGPLEASDAQYAIEAVYHRGLPGTGALPLTEFISSLPDGITLALETPNPPYRTAERLRRGYEAQAKLIEAAGAR